MFENYDIVIVGSGPYGSTIADLATKNFDLKVLIVEKRDHIGGTSWSVFDDETGIEYHKYGPHFFHTSNDSVWDYVNSFTKFKHYEPHLWSRHNGRIYPLPINLSTICQYFNHAMTPLEARKLIESQREFRDDKNLESKALATIGRPLYEAFIKNYTYKQWKTDPRDLPESTINRLPVRFTFDTRYFSDKYQGLPINGYGDLFTNMIKHPNIDVLLNTDFFDIKSAIPSDTLIIYTGPIDRYFNYSEGKLGWRTTIFEKSVENVSDYQGSILIFYPDLDVPFNRILEYKHLYPERDYIKDKTLLIREYSEPSSSEGDPYYPINTTENKKRYNAYKAKSDLENNVHFGGRLGTYQYIDIHQAIGMAMKDWEIISQRWQQ